MKAIKKWFSNRWFRRGIFVLTGALVGFAYYHFIGCVSGTCPITSNPYSSIAYGSILGLILSGSGKPHKDAVEHRGGES